MENENNSLFGTIKYNVPNDLNKFIDEMNPEQAIFCLVHQSRHAHKMGIFTMEESEVISKAVRILTTPQELENDVKDTLKGKND